MKSTFLLSLIFFAFAVAAKPKVVMFGGYGATASHMATWESGARSSRYGSRFDFKGEPYPGGGHGQGQVVKHGQALINKYVAEIKNAKDEYILVAHSSAGELLNAIANKLPKDAKVRMVLLDTFNAAANVQNKFPTLCYSYVNSMSACRNRHKFDKGRCNTRMCAHFRMVNATASEDLGGVHAGYQNFSPNLSWLETASSMSKVGSAR